MIAAELTSLERSFWGLFGWLNAPYPDLVYQFFRGLELLLAGGWLLALGRWAVRDRHTHARGDERAGARWAGGLLLLLWLAILAVSWLRFMHIAPAAQGRYFFPAAPALVMLIAVGLHGWGVWTLGRLIAGLLFLLSALTPWWIIQPAYQPPLPLALAADALTPVNAQLGKHFAIIGVDATPDELLPGEQATVRVAWRADQPPPVDYSVFVHLVDADGLIAAQHDTMPGGGLYPTSQWQAGETRVEAYTVTVPHTAFTPNHGRWAVGLYDAATGQRLSVTLDAPPAGDAVDAEAVDDALRFGAVAIIPAPGEVPNRLDVAFRDNVTLAGYTLNHRRLAPGDELEVTLYWQARGPVTGDYTAFVHLLDQAHAMHGDRRYARGSQHAMGRGQRDHRYAPLCRGGVRRAGRLPTGDWPLHAAGLRPPAGRGSGRRRRGGPAVARPAAGDGPLGSVHARLWMKASNSTRMTKVTIR